MGGGGHPFFFLRNVYVDFPFSLHTFPDILRIFAASEDNRLRRGATCERKTAVLQRYLGGT